MGPARSGPAAFRSRLTWLVAALLLLAGFGVVASRRATAPPMPDLGRALLFALVIAVLLAILVAYLLAADLIGAAPGDRRRGRPGRRRATSRRRSGSPGEDELARLAESHNRLAADLERRNRELGRILAAIERGLPARRRDLRRRRRRDRCRVGVRHDRCGGRPGRSRRVPVEEAVSRRAAARPRASCESGRAPRRARSGACPRPGPGNARTRTCSSCSRARSPSRSATPQLFAQVEAQNAQLLELDAAKDDFLRGVSHNLQTPLTSIRAYAEQLGEDRPDRRLGIIAEQSERLSRMVRQLLTVTRLESGALAPASEVVALAPRVRGPGTRSAATTSASASTTRSGWLAVADADQLDQVLWALLDNAVKYGGRGRRSRSRSWLDARRRGSG